MPHNRMQVIWTGVAGTPWYLTIRSSDLVPTVPSFAQAVEDFCSSYSAVMWNGLTLRSDGIVETVSDATEELIEIEGTGSFGYTGGNNSDPLPFATQLLVSLQTDTIGTVPGGNPHRIKGRINCPGLTEAQTEQGQFSSAVVTQFTGLFNTLNNAVGLGVFSKGGALTAEVTGLSVQQKPAVLRSRRD